MIKQWSLVGQSV